MVVTFFKSSCATVASASCKASALLVPSGVWSLADCLFPLKGIVVSIGRG